MRPEQSVEQHQQPDPGRRCKRRHARHDTEQADPQADDARQVDALDERKALAAAVFHHGYRSSADAPFIA
ncbi:hypothetical protein D3C80_1734290 [compost metagenome]